MPDRVKEKLVELLEKSPYLDCLFGYPDYEKAADDLIANGVTVQEWIPVAERLPELGVRVLIFDSYNGVSIGKALWVASPSMRRIELVAEEDAMYYTEITHWMPLPQPPKEG